MGSAKLRRDDVRDMVSAGATFPGNPHLTSHFQMSRGGMFTVTRAGGASDSGVRGGGGEGGGAGRVQQQIARGCFLTL